MARDKSTIMIGKWAFLFGVGLAVIFGLFSGVQTQAMTYLLILLGLVVGFLNVADKEVAPFLMSSAILVIVSSLSEDTMSGVPYVGSILQALLTLFVPATVVVAVKHVFSIAKH